MTAIAISFINLAACDKTRRPVTEPELIGKWSSVELITHRGNRGPAADILKFFANQTSTGFFKWSESYTTNAEALIPIPMSGTWSLSNGIINLKWGTNPVARTRIWFEGDLLVIEGSRTERKSASLTTIFKRSE